MGASEGTQVYADDQQITKIFGRRNILLALYPNTSEVNERAMAKEIKELSYVKNVTALADTLPEGIPEEFLPKSTVELLHKDGYCRMLIYTRTKTESAEAFKDLSLIHISSEMRTEPRESCIWMTRSVGKHMKGGRSMRSCGERINPAEQAVFPWIPAAMARRWRGSRLETGEQAADCTAGRAMRVNLSLSVSESRIQLDFREPRNSCGG